VHLASAMCKQRTGKLRAPDLPSAMVSWFTRSHVSTERCIRPWQNVDFPLPGRAARASQCCRAASTGSDPRTVSTQAVTCAL